MKKLIGCLMMLMLAFAACEGPMGPMGRDGRDGRDGKDGNDGEVTLWSVEYYTVKSNEWVRMVRPNGASYFECIKDAPQITEDYYYDGAIICYLLYNDDGYDVQTPLPYTYYNVDNMGIAYSIEYSFNVQPTVGNSKGTIAFRLTPNDMNAWNVAPPASSEFKLTLIY